MSASRAKNGAPRKGAEGQKKRRGGGGFLSGAATALALSGLAAVALSLNAPERAPISDGDAASPAPAAPVAPAGASETAQTPAPEAAPGQEAAPAQHAAAPQAPAPAAEAPVPEAPVPEAPGAPSDTGVRADPGAATDPHRTAAEPAAAPAIVGAVSEELQPEEPQASAPAAERAPDAALAAAPETASDAAPEAANAEAANAEAASGTAPASAAPALVSAAPAVDDSPPWRRNAARRAGEAGNGAPLAVVVSGLERREALAEAARKLGVLTFVVDPLSPGAEKLARTSLAEGAELLAIGAPASRERFAGVVVTPATARLAAQADGMLALGLDDDTQLPAVDAPAMRADVVLDGADDPAAGERALLALQSAALAAGAQGLVVYAAATQENLTTLARWRAATGTRLVALTDLARSRTD